MANSALSDSIMPFVNEVCGSIFRYHTTSWERVILNLKIAVSIIITLSVTVIFGTNDHFAYLVTHTLFDTRYTNAHRPWHTRIYEPSYYIYMHTQLWYCVEEKVI